MKTQEKLCSITLASTLMILFIIFVSFIASAATIQSALPTTTETRVTTNGAVSSFAIYKDKIVWDDYRNGEALGNIYIHDLLTSQETQISDSGTAYTPDIYGDKIVWCYDLNANSEIYMYNISTHEKTQVLTTESVLWDSISIYGDTIVWCADVNGNWNIFMHDLSTSQKTQITVNGVTACYPKIYRDRIVWVSGGNIYLYNISTSQENQITNSELASYPDIYSNNIVWQDSRNNDGSGSSDIYMYNLLTSQETQITTSGKAGNPVIYDNRIVWQDWRSDAAYGNIYMYDLSTSQETQITTNGFAVNPAIYGDRIAWQDWRNLNEYNQNVCDIYTLTLSGTEFSVGQGATTPEIAQKFVEACNRSGGLSVLGNPTTEVHSAFGFEVQDFPEMPATDGGVIMYNPNNNTAYFIHGAIWDKYYAYVDKARLGAVASDEGEAAIQPGKTTGRYTKFETGTIHWISDENLDHPQRGESFVTYGDLDKFYTVLGGTYSNLGFPVMDQEMKEDGHGYCEFEGGEIVWDDSTASYRSILATVDGAPTVSYVTFVDIDTSTPIIIWKYYDAEGESQQEYQIEVWTGQGGTGTKLWSTSKNTATTSITYSGSPLFGYTPYYLRIKVSNGSMWSVWYESVFTLSTVTFKPNPNGYRFKNFNMPELSTDAFHNTYGYNVDESNSNSKITTFYNTKFKNLTKNGCCFGMSGSSLNIYNHGIFNTYDYDKSSVIPDAWKEFLPFTHDYPPSTQDNWIAYYQPLQHDKACLNDRIKYSNLNGYNELKKRITSTSWMDDPMVLSFFWTYKDSNGEDQLAGHTVVPYKIEESADRKLVNISVYDCNHPGDINCKLTIDLLTGKVSDYDGWTNICRFDLVGLKSINESAELPDGVIDVDSSNAHLLLTDSSGMYLGFYQGEFKDEISYACPMISCSNATDGNSLESYYVPELSTKMELYGTGNGDSETSIITSNGLIIVNVSVAPNSVDEFKVHNEGKGIEFNSGSGTSSLSLMVDIETSDYAQIARANISQIETGGAVDLSNIDSTISIENNGQTRKCSLYLKHVGVSTNSDDSIKNIIIEEDSTVLVKPLNWNDIANSQVTIEHDVGSDGVIDSTEIIRPIKAEVTFDPETFNLNSTGDWVTAYIELPESYNVSVIDIGSVLMNGTVPAVSDPKYDFVTNESEYLTDLDLDGISERMFKFNRGDAARILKVGDKVTVTFTGKVGYNNGVSSGMASFEGSDIIRVTDSKNKKG